MSAGVGAFIVWPDLSDEATEAFALLQKTKAPPKLVFLTPAQYATVDALAETLIPANDHSPGASRKQAAGITPGKMPYDVIIVGSGAAGGMAAYQLAWTISRTR